MPSKRTPFAFMLVGAVVIWITPHAGGQAPARALPSAANGEWVHYASDIKGTRYLPLDQIDATKTADVCLPTFKIAPASAAHGRWFI